MPGLLCLYLVSIVFYLGSSSVSITLVYFENFHFSPPPVEFLFRHQALLKREAQLDELFSNLRIIHIGLFFLPYVWGFIIIVKRMSSLTYKFLRLFLSLVKLPGSEEKFYWFCVNYATQILVRRMWWSSSARLLYTAFNSSFRADTSSSKSNCFSVFLSTFNPCLQHSLPLVMKQGFSHGPSVTALHSSALYRTVAEDWLPPTHAGVTPIREEPTYQSSNMNCVGKEFAQVALN